MWMMGEVSLTNFLWMLRSEVETYVTIEVVNWDASHMAKNEQRSHSTVTESPRVGHREVLCPELQSQGRVWGAAGSI